MGPDDSHARRRARRTSSGSLDPRSVGWAHVTLRVAALGTLVAVLALDPSLEVVAAASAAIAALVVARPPR